jgi:hypothetical protein
MACYQFPLLVIVVNGVFNKKMKIELKQHWEQVAASRQFDGHLFLPEYGLLIGSLLNGAIDIHAFGTSRNEPGSSGKTEVNRNVFRFLHFP